MIAESNTTLSLIPISASTLSSKLPIGLDIYIRLTPNSKPILFCAKHEPLGLEHLQVILDKRMCRLYVNSFDYQTYQTYLRANWNQLVDNESLSKVDRVTLVSEVMRSAVSEQFTKGDTGTMIDAFTELSSTTSRLIRETPEIINDLSKVLHHDYATFTHSTNVSLYATALAAALGFTEQEQKEIAVGGLLHDIGKLKISDQILSKPGKLDDKEYREICKHPTIGFRQLMRIVDKISFGQLMMTYQHHEKMDGTGYPVGISGEDIHPWGRLCAVVDVYEALTSERPYRHPLSKATAVQILKKGSGTHFDAEMLQCWLRLIGEE